MTQRHYGWGGRFGQASLRPGNTFIQPCAVFAQLLGKSVSAEAVFQRIYETRAWGSAESFSGFGSELAYTQHLRAALPRLFQRYGIKILFDAPCGDMNWIRPVIKETGIAYHGVDIVAQIIARLGEAASSELNLLDADICRMDFPDADLWLCRDFWTHLSYEDISMSLTQFHKSRIPLLLTTSYDCEDSHRNKDIMTGGFRPIDLFKPPFRFPKPLFALDDWTAPWPKRWLMLWHRDFVPKQLVLESAVG
jgi:hypothetical protein